MCKQQDVSDASKSEAIRETPSSSRRKDSDKASGSTARENQKGYTTLHDAARDNAFDAAATLIEIGLTQY